ncbi:RICIN domain-containing protein [Dyadobacter psychrotolerans]|uniref:Ricin B lectin domain-containing protein n=1 Tax=Dyadobacter psychrotolerans TaxID=2541721 RepID=A0A4R5DUZ9_9BACT|nr:RICIN domain-containing protein [Dyadobacter psychrotolerans]TDE18366.1 hypothetical protein E0F88_02155 [Dyadobacter psychrotolerans]
MKVTAELKPLGAAVTCWALVPGLFWITEKVCDVPPLEARAYTAPAYSDGCFVAKKHVAGHYDDGYVITGNSQPSMDLVPGAYQNLFARVTDKAAREKWVYKIIPEINFTQTTFIPSVSSFALNNPNRDWGNSLSSINVQADTPFDALYAPENNNEEHTQVTKAGVDFVKAQLALADQQCSAPVLPLTDGCYTVKAKHSNKYSQPEDGSNGGRLRQYGASGQTNQIFQFETVDGDSYKITSKMTNMVWMHLV